MGIIDRIRELFGRKPSGAESTAVAGGAVVAASTADEDRIGGVDHQSDSGWFGGAGDAGGGGDGGAGGGDGGAVA
jgi:hypothetical protein